MRRVAKKPTSRRESSVSKAHTAEAEEEHKELFTEDLARTVSQILNGKKSKWLVVGESRKSLNNTLIVQIVGFVAHLIKIATIWSRGNAEGLHSVPLILKKILTEDIPLMRQTICLENKQI